MGQDGVGAKPAGANAEKLDQVLKSNQYVNFEIRDKLVADAMAPAPDSLSQRLTTVTKEAVDQIPNAFVNSVDAKNILPNVAIGSAFGATMKAVLPEAGPVGKAAAGAIGAWFLGKPLLESYYMAATASTNADMYNASHHLADSVGGMPVSIVESAVGAKLGSMAAGKMMKTAIAEPFVGWKAKLYEKLDSKVDGASIALKNSAIDRVGIGRPVPHEVRMLSGVASRDVISALEKNTSYPVVREPGSPSSIVPETVKTADSARTIDVDGYNFSSGRLGGLIQTPHGLMIVGTIPNRAFSKFELDPDAASIASKHLARIREALAQRESTLSKDK